MNSWRTTINCSRFDMGVLYCHLCTISLGKIIYGFFTLILLYLSNLCASGFEAHMNSSIKNRNSDILFQMFFFLLNVFTSRHFVPLSLNGVQRGVFMFRIIHPFDLSSWCFFPLSSQFCWNVRSWFQKDLIFAGIRYSKRL